MEVKRKLQVGAHYFEEGNVQLDTKHEYKDATLFQVPRGFCACHIKNYSSPWNRIPRSCKRCNYEKDFNKLLYSSRKEERCAGTVWLVSLTKYCGSYPTIQKMPLEIHNSGWIQQYFNNLHAPLTELYNFSPTVTKTFNRFLNLPQPNQPPYNKKTNITVYNEP